MKSLNAPVVEHSEVESKSSSSMSGYDSDLEDIEIELRRELIRLNNVRPKIVVRPVKEKTYLPGYYERLFQHYFTFSLRLK